MRLKISIALKRRNRSWNKRAKLISISVTTVRLAICLLNKILDCKYLNEFESDKNNKSLEDMLCAAIPNDKKLFFKKQGKTLLNSIFSNHLGNHKLSKENQEKIWKCINVQLQSKRSLPSDDLIILMIYSLIDRCL